MDLLNEGDKPSQQPQKIRSFQQNVNSQTLHSGASSQ